MKIYKHYIGLSKRLGRRVGRLPRLSEYIGCCVVCGLPKKRKIRNNGNLEDFGKFISRKTCGRITDCFKQYISGKGNPNYKGYMPKCEICGVKIAYKNAIEMSQGNHYRYCRKHATESYKNGEYHEAITKKNIERMKKLRGIWPEHLKIYSFTKGQRPHNKLYEDYTQCEIKGCIKKPVANFLCNIHYMKNARAVSL